MLVIFSLYDQIAKAWTLGEKRTEAFQNARLVLELMGRELESAVASSNTTSGKAVTFWNNPNSTTLPGTPATYLEATPPNDQLFFVSSLSDSPNQTYMDLAELGYFVVYAKADHQTMRGNAYYLIRHFANSDSSGFDIFTNPTAWDDTPDYATTTKTPILDNVLRLDFRFQAPPKAGASWNGTADASTFGTAVCDAWNSDNSCPNAGLGSPCDTCVKPTQDLGYTSPQTQLPRAVHIRLALLDRRYAARLAGLCVAKGWTTASPAGIPEAELRMVIPNCKGEDINTLAATDAPLANILREGVHIFYKTVYLRNADQ